jgi:predicted nucleotidyltransferase
MIIFVMKAIVMEEISRMMLVGERGRDIMMSVKK